MIDVKTAVAKAIAFLTDMYQDEQIQDARLEEVERSEDGASWHITISFLRKIPSKGVAPVTAAAQAFSHLMSPQLERDYKLVTVGAENGEVRSMKIRTLV